MNIQAKHIAVFAAFLTGIAVQLGTAQHGWADTLTPGFVSGVLIQLASAITAIFVDPPAKP